LAPSRPLHVSFLRSERASALLKEVIFLPDFSGADFFLVIFARAFGMDNKGRAERKGRAKETLVFFLYAQKAIAHLSAHILRG